MSYYGVRQRVEEHLSCTGSAPILGLPHHRLRALERRARRQDRRPHLARHRHPRARLLHLTGTGILPEHAALSDRLPTRPTPRRHAHDRPPAVQGPGHRRLLRRHEPVLRITPGTGERITFETDDLAYAQMEELRDLSKVTATMNPVTGPVHVEGAEPGDALARHDPRHRAARAGLVGLHPRSGRPQRSDGRGLVRPADPHPRRTGAPHRRPDLPGRPHDRLHRRGAGRRRDVDGHAVLPHRRQHGPHRRRARVDGVPARRRWRGRCCRSATSTPS